MKRKMIQWLGLTGVIALFSYTAAVLFAPLAFPGYDWMAQAVSDLSAESAPSRILWNRLAAPYGICSTVCLTLVSLFVREEDIGNGTFRLGIYLFTVMMWISAIGYAMFPLADEGKTIASFTEIMHITVTVLVVILSIVSLILLFLAGIRDARVRSIGIAAGIAFWMMGLGAVGTGVFPPQYFGIAERFSIFATVGFTAVLGVFLFLGFPDGKKTEGKPERRG